MTQLVSRRLCPVLGENTPMVVAGTVASGCNEIAAEQAHSGAARLAAWLSSSEISGRVTAAAIEAFSGLGHVRMTARALRATVVLLGWGLVGLFVAFCAFAWRLRTFATLLGVACMGGAVLLTPFVTFFTWVAPKIFGAEAGEIAVTAAGLQPFGAGLHVVLALLGVGLLLSRLFGPRVRDRFWAARIGHADPWVHAVAVRLSPVPAGVLEPLVVGRVLLRRRPRAPGN